ncbi:MAG: thioredoxin domain-containing protein [bacterium]|nr:thioredoxin domain-containing protein [bacterium]
MAEDQNTIQDNNNMKIAVTIIILLVVLLAVAVFSLQQKKNSNSVVSDTAATNTTENTGSASGRDTVAGDAGSLGKNEVKLTDANFASEVENSKGVFLVDFYLSTCPHCQKVAKDVTAVSDELVGKAKVGKLEGRESNTTATKYNVQGVPTFIVFKDGKQVDQAEGERTKQQLLDMVNKYLK